MTPEDLERVYEALAEALDAAPPDTRELLLAKLALLMARELDADHVIELITSAKANLDR